MQCPCNPSVLYDNCCKPYHENHSAPTALALMRSRYSAFALGLVDYLVATTHPDNPVSQKELETHCQQTRFLSLEILEVEEAFVTFRASFIHQMQPMAFTERSYFMKVGGRWLYHSGIVHIDAIEN